MRILILILIIAVLYYLERKSLQDCFRGFSYSIKPEKTCVMPDEEFRARAEKWKRETAEKGSSSVSLTKDTEKRLHACLIPWEELDDLSEKVSDITGRKMDYKQMDRNNVLAMRDVLSAASGHEI